MTKTYNDIEAVTRLLQEKERDLELAARIGQTLLDRNEELEQDKDQLESQLATAYDQLKQLRHDLNLKESRLRIYYQDDDEGQDEEDSINENNLCGLHLRNADVEHLARQVDNLQSENALLKAQSEFLEAGTMEVEEKEAELLADCAVQLRQKTSQLTSLQDELALKNELLSHQQDEISSLTTQKLSVQVSNSKLALENTELEKHLSAAVDAQRQLTSEVCEWESRYEELLADYMELRQEMKSLQRKQKPAFIRHHYTPLSPYLPHGSLALELEDSLKREVEFPRGYSPSERMTHSQRVMDTVKSVRETGSHLSASTTQDGINSSGMGTSIEGDMDSLLDHYPLSPMSSQGYPDDGGELHTALRRLATRKANDINECMVHEREACRLAARRRGECVGGDESESPLPPHTPDSCLSMDSNLSSINNRHHFIPEKLQIVKPLEGSLTLHQWQRLATPHMGGILAPRPGVQIKGDRYYLDSDQEQCDFSDFEEDDDFDATPGKAVGSFGGTYTYTTSKIIHPSDEYTTTSVYGEGPRASVSVSESAATRCHETLSAPQQQRQQGSQKEGTSTFSMSQDQASGLKERGAGPKPPVSMTTLTAACATQSQPRRFPSLVAETHCRSTHSQTQTAYSTDAVFMAPVDAVDNTTAVAYHPEQSYLNLVNKIKDMGLNNIMDIASGPGLAPVKLDPIDVGFNTILSIKRDRSSGPSQTYSSVPLESVHRRAMRGVVQRRVSPGKAKKSSNNLRSPRPAVTTLTSTPAITVTATVSGSTVLASHLGYASMPLPSTYPVSSSITRTSLSRPYATATLPITSVSTASSTRPAILPLKANSPNKTPVTLEEIGVTGAKFPTNAPSAADSFIGAGLGWLKRMGTNVSDNTRSALTGDGK